MLIYGKNLLFFFYYALLCFLMLSNHIAYVKGWYFSFFPMMMMYYMVMLHPYFHMLYIYSVMEKRYFRCKQVWQLFFHICLGYISTPLYLFLYKELFFIIKFAEKRLAKIEESIVEKIPSYRIAHLHLNTFKEDMDNRFHYSCFDTSRLYLLETTQESKKTQLGISNYREIRRKQDTPREMSDEETIMYTAASNQTLFLSNRKYYIISPIVILAGMLLIETSNTLNYSVHATLIFIDVATYIFTPPRAHDIFVDVSYASAALIFALVYYNNTSVP